MTTPLELPDWTSFKATCITVKGLKCQYSDMNGIYQLYGPDARQIMWHTSILKAADGETPSADQAAFEAVKATFNQQIEQLDSDGALMSRSKIAPSGWTFHLREIEFKTALFGSLYNKTPAQTVNDALTDATLSLYGGSAAPLTDAKLTLYDTSGAVITDPANQGNCVISVLDVEPPHDYYIIGGLVKMLVQPTQDVRLSVVGVPDVPASYGGSKILLQNVNLIYLLPTDGINADGRSPKWLQFSPTLHTNKLRFIVVHDPGYQMKLGTKLEYYKF